MALTETCHYCKLVDHRVEAVGVWHCPNPLCPGPGAAHWRQTHCKSARSIPNTNAYEVSATEVLVEAKKYIDAMPYKELPLISHILSWAPWWEKRAAEESTV